MLSFQGKSLSLLVELATDASCDQSDPLTHVFFVQSWLNATRNMLNNLVASMSSSELLDKMLLDIQEWRLDNPDSMYMCLSCIALLLPDVLGPYGDHSSYVKDISDDVYEAYNSHVFEDADVARLCLGFVGVCDLSLGSTRRLQEIVKTLEQSVAGYGGQHSFGAYFGLAVIAQACAPLFVGEDSKRPDLGMITRIVSFLVNQLSKCIDSFHEGIPSLVKCINRGDITPEVIENLTAMKKKSLKMQPSKAKSAKSIFISFAICLPALAKVNDELLLGIYCLLESLAWGSGKGFCLPSVLQTCRQTGLFEKEEVEKMYTKYARVFEEGMEQGVDGLDDIFYAVTAIQSKSIPYSIRKFMVGNRNLFDESGRALSLVSAVVSVSSIPCLGRAASVFFENPRLSQKAASDDITGVVESVSEGSANFEGSKYSEMAIILLGFLSGLGNSNEADKARDDIVRIDESAQINPNEKSHLPQARPGTVLEEILSTLQDYFADLNDIPEGDHNIQITKLLSCFETLSLPGQFSDFLETTMYVRNDAMKAICVRLMVSQIQGRPRAVFDGHEFVNLALSMTKMPTTALRTVLGDKEAAEIFVASFGEVLPKFTSQVVEEAAEGIFRFCIPNSFLTSKFLESMKDMLHRAVDSKSFRLSPKSLHSIQLFLIRRVFAGIRDASWGASGNGLADQRAIIEAYTDCLMQIPSNLLVEAEFFTVQELDGFFGESLRIRVIMTLVRKGYFSSPSDSFGEVASSVAWMCRQLVSCDEEISSCTILHVACTIARASGTIPFSKKKELLTELLDNLLIVRSMASFVGLEVLAVVTYEWCQGSGSSGDLSLLYALSPVDKWQDLTPQALRECFRLVLHDMPFNLAKFSRREKMSGVVFNRLWRIYVKWWEQGRASYETLFHLRRALLCCRDDGTAVEDLVTLTTSMVLQS